MLAADIPSRFVATFANTPDGGTFRTVPVTPSGTPGAASLEKGFPAICFIPVGSGGVPPFGEDFNGILNQITAWNQWQAAGGPTPYNAAFSTAVGGYPQGAVLASTTAGRFWISTADGNTTDPDGGSPANWRVFVDVNTVNVYVSNPNGHVAGTVGVVPYTWPSMCWDPTNHILWACTTSGDAASAVWNQVKGGLGNGLMSDPSTDNLMLKLADNSLRLSTSGVEVSNAYLVDTTGSGNAIVVTPSPAIGPIDGRRLWIVPRAVNTGAVTLNATGAAIALVRCDGAALQAGDSPVIPYEVTYDGTLSKWRMSQPPPSELAGVGLKGDGAGALALDIHGLTLKASPDSTDEVAIGDSAAGYADKKTTLNALGVTLNYTDFLRGQIYFMGMM